MTGSELFDVWAPAESVWSRWAKPVLFVDEVALFKNPPPSGELPGGPPLTIPELSFNAGSSTAVVVDLPGEQSVLAGLALARRGHRPVPLFNGADHPAAIVSTALIFRALKEGAPELASAALLADAPPAFLIDSRRLLDQTHATPGKYDNRWLVFPQDFPSANFLLSRQIRRVLLLHEKTEPQEDLAHVLLRWQEAGIEIVDASPTTSGFARPLEVRRPSSFRALAYRVFSLLGLRRNSAGGFGGIVPQPSSSSGGRSGFS